MVSSICTLRNLCSSDLSPHFSNSFFLSDRNGCSKIARIWYWDISDTASLVKSDLQKIGSSLRWTPFLPSHNFFNASFQRPSSRPASFHRWFTTAAERSVSVSQCERMCSKIPNESNTAASKFVGPAAENDWDSIFWTGYPSTTGIRVLLRFEQQGRRRSVWVDRGQRNLTHDTDGPAKEVRCTGISPSLKPKKGVTTNAVTYVSLRGQDENIPLKRTYRNLCYINCILIVPSNVCRVPSNACILILFQIFLILGRRRKCSGNQRHLRRKVG